MNTLLVFFGVILMSVAAIFSVWWFLGSLFTYLGEKGVFFSTVKEGQIKVARRGGIVTLFFGKIPGHTINKETGEITDEVDNNPRGWLENKFGIQWIGFPPWYSIYHYRFKWNKWARPAGKPDYEIIPRDEIVDSVYFRAPYALELKDLETKDRLGLTAVVVFTVKIVNARIALFLTSDWLANISAEVTAAIRDFFGQREYNSLIMMQNEIGDKTDPGKKISEFINAVKSLNDDGFGNEALPKKFGVWIDDVSLLSIEIGEPKGDLAKATHAKYVAERKQEATLVDADATAGKILKEAKAKADEILMLAEADAKKVELLGETTAVALRKLHKALGADGNQIGQIKLSEAISEAKTQTVVLGGTANPILGLNPSGKT